MSFEHLFATSVLNVVVPDTSVEFPSQGSGDEWLSRLESGRVERSTAFFDEQLQSLLTVRIENPAYDSPADPQDPPQALLTFLAHSQISLEATYISSVPTTPNPDVRISRLSAPPRSAPSKSNSLLQAHSHHPSILPPSTPNPTPSSADHDRRYVTSEGTLLLASIWGQSSSEDTKDRFSLLWSEKEQVWVAVYRLSFTVSFLRLSYPDPLLCITVSATLRDKPITLAQPNHPLAVFFSSIGSQLLAPPESPTTPNGVSVEQEEETYDILEEVNLLEGLLAGTTFSSDQPINLPSTRLGTVSRQKLFSLPPVSLPSLATPSPSPMTAVRTAHPTLRKSYRKTLSAVSGFRVRMRTVFIPYVLLPEIEGSSSTDEAQEEREKREAGNEERTVVLCVEVENSGESGPNTGFLVEKVNVSIGGEGAKATLIGWGDDILGNKGMDVFPLSIGAMAQYNLLYAVSFLRAPEEVEGFSLARDAGGSEHSSMSELQRAVTINIFGKPYKPPKLPSDGDTSYPTSAFSSRWNCVLDLSTHQMQLTDSLDAEDYTSGPHALPEPASPFPPSTTPRTANFLSPNGGAYSAGSTPQSSATAGSKRHTMPINAMNSRPLRSSSSNRPQSVLSPLSPKGRESPFIASSKTSYMPPSVSAQIPRSPTTYTAPSQSMTIDADANRPQEQMMSPPPMTPAYPAYPPLSAVPRTPISQGPITSQNTGNVGPSVEIRRERGTGMGGVPVPQTPGPWVTGGFGEQKALTQMQMTEQTGESIVVSVSLLPPESSQKSSASSSLGSNLGKIYPLDRFTLDIFVFNQSEWTRRFEVTCPTQRKRHKGGRDSTSASKKVGHPGILPLDARVRIGPLRPSACQSVRIEFLAIAPGVHSIDALTLTDVQSGHSINLRSVMDVVVHGLSD